MLYSKFFNIRKFLNPGRLNNNQLFYTYMTKFYSDKDKDGIESSKSSQATRKDENKSKNSLNRNNFLAEDTNTSVKITKIHGNMTGMDKIDGMAGQTAGISSSNGKGEVRPEEGIYIYSGGLNLNKEKSNGDENTKKTSKKD